MPVVHVNSVDAARQLIRTSVGPIVVVPVYNGFEDAARCYSALFEHTSPSMTILVVDDGGADRRPIEILDELGEEPQQDVVILHREINGGFVAACNDAFDAADRHDVIIVNSDVVVGPEWCERLTAAAQSSSLIATASTLTNHGSILSVPNRNHPDDRIPSGLSPDEAALRVSKASLMLRPTIPTAIGHCVYIKRQVIDLVGPFDTAFGTGYGEEVDFSQRAVKAGFRHCCADDVFTFHRGGSSFGDGASAQQIANEAIVDARYPWYRNWVVRASTDAFSPLSLALDRARVALDGLSVAIDATSLGQHWSGTQAVVLENIRALAPLLSDASGTLTVLHSPAITEDVRELIEALPDVRLLGVDDIRDDHSRPADIVYRPHQVNSIEELRWLRQRGRRVVVNQLDLISWSNPSYFRSDHAWLSQRELTRLTLACVDGVAFISDFVRKEVEAERLIPDGTPRRVVHCGTTSAFDDAEQSSSPPTGMPHINRPFMLVLGASYHHKNRIFAIRVLRELRSRGWDGALVLAGPTPPRGNSMGDEVAALLRETHLGDHVITLGDLTESEKSWLYARAALSLYPTCSEGFGLVPFESARRNVPVLSSRQGSLDEVLPHGILTLDGYDPSAAADQAWDLLHKQDVRNGECAAIAAHAGHFTWQSTAEELLELFEQTLRKPRNATSARWGEGPAPSYLDAVQATEPSRTNQVVERQIQRLLALDGVKRAAAPEGSRRQAVARNSANWLRRTSRGR